MSIPEVNCYSIPGEPDLAVVAACPFCGAEHQHGINPSIEDQGIRRSGCCFTSHGRLSGQDYNLILAPGAPPERVPDHQTGIIGQFLRESMLPAFGNSLPFTWLLVVFSTWLQGRADIPESKLCQVLGDWGFSLVGDRVLSLEFKPAIYSRYDNQFLKLTREES